MLDDDTQFTKINAAIAAHMMWLARFQAWVQGNSQETIDPAIVHDDTACAFGKWLYSTPDSFQDKQAYEKVKVMHKEFHATAAELADLTRQGPASPRFATLLSKLSHQSLQLIRLLDDVTLAIKQAARSP